MKTTRAIAVAIMFVSAANMLGIIHLSVTTGALIFAGAIALLVGTHIGNRNRG